MLGFNNSGVLTLKCGNEEDRCGHVFEAGEGVFVLDTRKVYIGDGQTPGGIEWPGFDGKFPSLEYVRTDGGKRYFRLLADGVPVRPMADEEAA